MHVLARERYVDPMEPRRKQSAITIRSARAAARLRVLTRTGRSQAAVVEEALDRMPDPVEATDDRDARRARIEAILDQVDPSLILSMEEFDAREYDEHGLPR